MTKELLIAQKELQRKSFQDSAILYGVFSEFSLESEESINNLINYLKVFKRGVLLPSGRYGTPLALALELRFYQVASFMLKNAQEFNIDLNSVSSELGGANRNSAEEAFQFSLLGFDRTKLSEDDELYKRRPELIQSYNKEIDAAEELEHFFANNLKR